MLASLTSPGAQGRQHGPRMMAPMLRAHLRCALFARALGAGRADGPGPDSAGTGPPRSSKPRDVGHPGRPHAAPGCGSRRCGAVSCARSSSTPARARSCAIYTAAPSLDRQGRPRRRRTRKRRCVSDERDDDEDDDDGDDDDDGGRRFDPAGGPISVGACRAPLGLCRAFELITRSFSFGTLSLASWACAPTHRGTSMS
jgi:hypothetical protein